MNLEKLAVLSICVVGCFLFWMLVILWALP